MVDLEQKPRMKDRVKQHLQKVKEKLQSLKAWIKEKIQEMKRTKIS